MRFTRYMAAACVALIASISVPAACTFADAATHRPTSTQAPAAVGIPAKPNVVIKAEAGPKRGGILRITAPSNPAQYDLINSSTGYNVYPQFPMYDNLIRYNPLDGGRTIIPDLASKWTVSPDNLTYTFYLRSGVKFHDGTPLTSDDVVASFQRIISPPKGVVSLRQQLFAAVKSVEATGPLTVRFTWKEPRANALAIIAMGYNVILSKKSLEANNYNLAKVSDYPGTGPFKFVSHKAGEVWKLEKNRNYWNTGLPYLDGLEIYHTENTSDRCTAVLTGLVDYGSNLNPSCTDPAKPPKGFATMAFQNYSATGVWLNLKKAPWNDAKVRRAMSLVMDRPGLIKAMYAASERTLGYWTVPGGAWGLPLAEVAKTPGYRTPTADDIAEAKKLMAEAGYPNGMKNVVILGRGGEIHTEAVAVGFQNTMKEIFNIDSTIRRVDSGVYWGEIAKGNWDWAAGGSTAMMEDPSVVWEPWFVTGAAANYGGYSNPAFDELMKQIGREVDPVKRMALIRQGEAILNQDVPILNAGWEKVQVVYRTYVKGWEHNRLGQYNAWRLDTAWMDK